MVNYRVLLTFSCQRTDPIVSTDVRSWRHGIGHGRYARESDRLLRCRQMTRWANRGSPGKSSGGLLAAVERAVSQATVIERLTGDVK
jgi:hypothetical protein